MKLENHLEKDGIHNFIKQQLEKRQFVITPISILKKMGLPVSSHSFILENKNLILKLKLILHELYDDGILSKRQIKQGYKGLKEIGYDYIFKNEK